MKRFLKRLFGANMFDMQPLDQELINQFLANWNSDRPVGNPLWVEVQDTNAMVQMDIDVEGKVTFRGDRGYPIKAFLNTETQELRIFDARRFMRR